MMPIDLAARAERDQRVRMLGAERRTQTPRAEWMQELK